MERMPHGELLFGCLWDWGIGKTGLSIPFLLHGTDYDEWTELIRHDYDAVDRFYIDRETIGGG